MGGKGWGDLQLYSHTIEFNRCDFISDAKCLKTGFNLNYGIEFHVDGNAHNSSLFTVSILWGGTYRSSALLKSMFKFCSLIFFHVSANDIGSFLFKKLCINFALLKVISFSKDSIFNFLKIGAVWSQKLQTSFSFFVICVI